MKAKRALDDLLDDYGASDLKGDAQYRARKGLERYLEVVRERWRVRETARKALSVLKEALAVLPAGDSGSLANRLHREIECIALAVAPAAGCRTAEDEWLLLAQKRLDDDDLASALSPAGYRRNRSAALVALRNRRQEIRKRVDAEHDALLAEMPWHEP